MSAPRVPQSVSGVDFDEPFFNAVIKRAGGQRLTDVFPAPPETKQADYFIDGYAVELKILELEPLERDEHQQTIARLFAAQRAQGNLVPVADKPQVRVTGDAAKQFWRIIGKPVQRHLQSAEKQLRATRGFLPMAVHTAVLLVNAGALSLDHPTSFFNLAADYHARFSGIDAVYALSAIPVPVQGTPALVFARIDLKGAHGTLGDKIDAAIQHEVIARTGGKIDPVASDPRPGQSSVDLPRGGRSPAPGLIGRGSSGTTSMKRYKLKQPIAVVRS